MKTLKRVISLVLAVVILALANVSEVKAVINKYVLEKESTVLPFKDIKTTDWYCDYVIRLTQLKITSGYTDGTYKPNNTLTRAEFVTFLCKATGLTQEDGYTYSDTKKHWASKWISAAIVENIIDKGAVFNPDKAITRQEAAEMLCRSLNLPEDVGMKTPYADVKADTGYINSAYKEYLMQGSIKNNLRYFYPSSTLTRAEAAAVIVNLVNYKADPVGYKTTKIGEMKDIELITTETARYNAWKESVKGISPELLNNTEGVYKGSLYNSYKYLRDETDYLKNWGAKYGMTPEQFENEMVRVGTEYGNTWANANYKKVDELETKLKALWETDVITGYLKRNLDYVTNNTIVSEGSFTTSTGMLVFADWGNPVLRGTLKCKYISPTSINILNSDKVGSSGEYLKLDTWYEQDFEIRFYSEKSGIKITKMQAISDIRISK